MSRKNNKFQRFLLLWSGELISAIGSGLTSFALGVYVYRMTGQASAMALITLLAFLPPLLLSPFAGVLADRYDRRLLMMIGDGLSAIGLLFILYCIWDGSAALWQIGVGVSISSVFSALLEPSYKATITDLLTEEEYSKASGMVQIAGSARYLISPMLAGFLLTMGGIKLILIIDISTFFVTVITTLVVRKGLESRIEYAAEEKQSYLTEFQEGIQAIGEQKGIWTLIIISSFLTFYIAFIQTLSAPMILSFADASVLGIGETVSAMGMLVTSLLLGVLGIQKNYTKILSVSLFCAGIFMAGFGLRENIYTIVIFGFLFFAMLPFANMSLDCLIRKSIDNKKQGRVWGVIGIVSQMGYVIAYGSCGFLADYIFIPLLLPEGGLADTVGKIIGVGSGRGIGFLIIAAGFFVSVLGIVVRNHKGIRQLEEVK